MMAEVNFLAGKLQLKEHLPIRGQDTIAQRALEPGTKGFTGGIDTLNYSFGFAHSGRFRVITKLEDDHYQSMGLYRGNQSMEEFIERLSQIKSTINTNDAYRIATNWLALMDIDVDQLQRKNPLKIQQEYFQSEKSGEIPLPLFHVEWGEEGRDGLGHTKLPMIKIMISGINGELLSFYQRTDSYSKRPSILIKDLDKLLAIPDAEYLKYSPLERSNLVARFAAITYPTSTNELHSLSSQTNAPAETNLPAKK